MSLLEMLRQVPRSKLDPIAPPAPRRAACEQRGYCGPFVNQALYNSLHAWQGFGDCVECGRAVPVPGSNPRALAWSAAERAAHPAAPIATG